MVSDQDEVLDALWASSAEGDCLVVLGERGSGRTVLHRALAGRLERRGYPVVCLELGAATGIEALVAALRRCIGDDDPGVGLDGLLGCIARDGVEAALLVDDADYLTLFALEALLDARRHSAPSLRIVLWGGMDAFESWRTSPSLRERSIRRFEIPRLSPARARELVETLLDGRQVEDRVIRRIVRDGQGLPGRLREAVREVSAGDALGRRRSDGEGRRARRPVVLAVSLLVALSLGAGIGYRYLVQGARSPDQGAMTSDGPSLASAESAPASIDAGARSDRFEPEPGPRPVAASPRVDDAAPDSVAATRAPSGQVNSSASVSEGGRVADSLPETMAAGPVDGEGRVGDPRQAKGSSDGGARETVAAAAGVRTKSTRAAAVHGPDWFSTLDPTAYAIQLVTFKTRKEAERYIRKNGIGREAAFLETRHRGRPLFLVVYGVYPDRKAAVRAAAALPKALRRYEPWVRRVETLRKIAGRPASTPP